MKIYSIAQAKGSVHDFNLFKNSYTGFPKQTKVQADSGYQGIKNIHENSETPKKASKLHINSHIKRFKILSTRYRNKRKKHKLRMSLICGVYNYELN